MASLTDASGRLVGITAEDYTGQSCWARLRDFPVSHTETQFLMIIPWEPEGTVSGPVNFSPKAPTNLEVRGQVKNLEGPQLFLLLRLWVAKVLQSTISAPVSPLLSQRKGIQQGPKGPSQSPVAREMGVSLTTMDKSLMTSRQCTLAPHCYHDKEKCFHKHMLGLEEECFLFSVFILSEYHFVFLILWFPMIRWGLMGSNSC